MRLAKLEVTDLFNRYNHSIVFPTAVGNAPRPSFVVLHGPNGIGKTTILRMLRGIMQFELAFFFEVPFSRCALHFDTGEQIQLQMQRKEASQLLQVEFAGQKIHLVMRSPDSAKRSDSAELDAFRAAFFTAIEPLTFDFIDTSRLLRTNKSPYRVSGVWSNSAEQFYYPISGPQLSLSGLANMSWPVTTTTSSPPPEDNLASKVAKFISDAQVNFRAFFTATEPDLFSRILQRLAASKAPPADPSELRRRLTAIRDQDLRNARFGLERDQWDYDQLVTILNRGGTDGRLDHTLAVLSAYVEVLESRAAEQALVADRLQTFEQVMADFFLDKRVVIEAKKGLTILTESKLPLQESQLSSGEYHLLYLMVSALLTRRRGTIIAIDEPEMSMHLAWQRKLIPALLRCASHAAPQFIFATHSPDIAAEYPEALVPLSAGGHKK